VSADLHGNTLRNTSAHGGFGADTSAGLAQRFSHASTRDSFPGAWGCTRTDSTRAASSFWPTVLRRWSTSSRTSFGTCGSNTGTQYAPASRRARQERARDLLRSLHRGVRDSQAAGVETGERVPFPPIRSHVLHHFSAGGVLSGKMSS
jgi:hypothetical protein